jgi:hypothetical protein
MMLSNGCSHVVNGLMPRSPVCAPPPTRARFAETASKDPNQISYLVVRQTPGGRGRTGPASKPNREAPIERVGRQEIGNTPLRD